MNEEVRKIIENLRLEAHPEGGWYRQTWQSANMLPSNAIPDHGSSRPCSTSIYFLLTSDNFSAFHRIKSDEIWYHHAGDPLEIIILDENRVPELLMIGSAQQGKEPQAVAPAGKWFASRVLEGGEWALVGCAVAPGFDFSDFALAERQELLRRWPVHEKLILSLTRTS